MSTLMEHYETVMMHNIELVDEVYEKSILIEDLKDRYKKLEKNLSNNQIDVNDTPNSIRKLLNVDSKHDKTTITVSAFTTASSIQVENEYKNEETNRFKLLLKEMRLIGDMTKTVSGELNGLLRQQFTPVYQLEDIVEQIKQLKRNHKMQLDNLQKIIENKDNLLKESESKNTILLEKLAKLQFENSKLKRKNKLT
eukprot:TRINITY_DN1458_c0_g1_i1.p3 TRINITY_DN1458_c0_g1~~TRINITY_DN1458_c0_g1_i1.p3  ORF type:complete len:196 (+),score=51.32 TRINITY_DN1458_c0_g1_i1:59-646(+)